MRIFEVFMDIQKSSAASYRKIYKFFLAISTIIVLGSCSSNTSIMGTYAYDIAFLNGEGIETVELISQDGLSRIATVPAWQGRVATSTSRGGDGDSYGWLNHAFIAAGETSPQFNNYGGEERFWLGPEGGEGSWFFAPGAEQIFPHWVVPAPFDTDSFQVTDRTQGSVTYLGEAKLRNARNLLRSIRMQRKVTLLEKEALERLIGPVPDGVSLVAYSSNNAITNDGDFAWNEESGMPSVWMLGMFSPSETTTVFIPYNPEGEGPLVKDDYFGPMPEGRLRTDKGFILFTIDGKYRSKIGLSAGRSLGLIGAFDPVKGLLTILKTDLPAPGERYVNSQWGKQEDAFGGDALNAYNDGPTEDGTLMGPFFEMESSSPAAALSPGQTLVHSQTTIHIAGPNDLLKQVIVQVFGACPDF